MVGHSRGSKAPSLRLRRQDVRFLRRKLVEYSLRSGRTFPWRDSRDPYQSLVTEVLLRQTAAWKVESAYAAFFKRFPNAVTLGAASIRDIRLLIWSLGLHSQRAPQLKALGGALTKDFSGSVPLTYEELLELPGVGPYAANALISFTFGRPRAIVDTNVERVLSRYFGKDRLAKGARKRWSAHAASISLARSRHQRYNYGLLDLAADVCKVYTPQCRACPLHSHCKYPRRKGARMA